MRKKNCVTLFMRKNWRHTLRHSFVVCVVDLFKEFLRLEESESTNSTVLGPNCWSQSGDRYISKPECLLKIENIFFLLKNTLGYFLP
jgi:hypothetical protein